MRKAAMLEWLEGVCRIGLGMMFVYSAWGKVGDPGIFADMVMRYELLPEFAIGLFALTLPMVELLAGLTILCTKWMREAALLIAGMLVMFIVALASAVVRGLEIDCGCFGVPSVGGRTELVLAIVRDVVLLAPAVWLMFRRNAWIGVRGVLLLAVALLACGAVRVVGCSSPDPEKPTEDVPTHQAVAQPSTHKGNAEKEKKTRKERQRSSVAKVLRAEKPIIEVDDDDDLPPAEKKLLESIEEALDKEDLAEAQALAGKAMASGRTEIRQAMVDTLGWFGVKALPELTPFLADADEDVRESAMNEWSMAVSQIEDDGEKIGVVEMAMHVLSDEDALEDISGEYIGTDEKLAVESLLRIIEAGGSEKGIEKAKETYEFVTGETFTDRAAAEKWIKEEYEPPAEQGQNDAGRQE